MAESSLFWAGTTTGDAGPYSDDAFSDFVRKTFLQDRTLQGPIQGYLGQLAVTGATSPVAVATGAALVDGKFYENTASLNVVVPSPVSATRIDRIVLRKNFAGQTIRVTRIAGTEGSGTPPAITQTEGTTWDVQLAKVSITTAGLITITDERSFCYTANVNVWRSDNDGPGSGLNADLLDDAEKDTDVTLSGNSDYAIPTEKAVKAYIDANRNIGYIRYNNATFSGGSYPGGSEYKLTFNSTKYTYDHNSSITWNGSDRYTINKAGIYTIDVCVKCTVVPMEPSIYFKVNGNRYAGQTMGWFANGYITVSRTLYLNVSDYVEAYAYLFRAEGGTSTTIAAGTANVPDNFSFSIHKV